MAKKLKKKTQKKSLLTSKKIKSEVFPQKPTESEIKKTRIRVIGIGGGGGNILSEIASKIAKASFVAANTDLKSLRSCSRKVVKFQFGQSLTHGLGTGMNPELGKEAALSEKERIKKLCQGQDLCILVASLGGGTGSGAVSTFAKISRNLGNLTYGIFTLPFKFEGEKKMEIALNSLREVRNHLNVLTVISSENVFKIINKDTPLKEALSAINKFLSESLGGLIETIYEPGLINIDFADFSTILEGRGKLAYLNTVEERRKEDAVEDIAGKVLSSPLYPYTIKGAKGVLFNIVGEKNLSLSEVNQISKKISELVNPEAKIIFGISQKAKRSNVIKTVLLATDCDRGARIASAKETPKKTEKRKKKKKKPIPQEIPVPKALPQKKKKKKNKPEKKTTGAVNVEKQTEKPEEKKEEEKIRKNGLQIKKEVEDLEKEMVEKEKFWETPAFLRKKFIKDR